MAISALGRDALTLGDRGGPFGIARTATVLALAVAAGVALSGCVAFPRIAVLPRMTGRVISAIDQQAIPMALVIRTAGVCREAVGHSVTSVEYDDCRLTDDHGGFAFPMRLVAFWHLTSLPFLGFATRVEDGCSVLAGPALITSAKTACGALDIVFKMAPDALQTGDVHWTITPSSVAAHYLVRYQEILERIDHYLSAPSASAHPQYQRLVEFRAEMARKVAEYEEKVKTAQDFPVLDRVPPP